MELKTSLSKKGFHDWVIQRVTAIILGLYLICFLGCLFLLDHPLTFEVWRALFSSPFAKYATLVAILSLISHAWIGLWTITTDYLNPKGLRLIVQWIIILALFYCVIWSIEILWKV